MGITQNVALKHDAWFVGQVADIEVKNTVTKVNTDAEIGFGVAVAFDGDEGMKALTSSSTSANICGITVREYQHVGEGIPAHATATVMTMGVVAVKVATDVTVGSAVYAGTGANVLGQFTNVAGSGATLAVALTGAKFRTSAKAGEIALVALNVGA